LGAGLVGLLTACFTSDEKIIENHRAMIVCSCNVLSDQDVRSAVEAERTCSISEVYDCLGCSPQCGRCARTIRRIRVETLGSACATSCTGCGAASAQHVHETPSGSVA
jgi:bacterioferritin-associated ferredoxin